MKQPTAPCALLHRVFGSRVWRRKARVCENRWERGAVPSLTGGSQSVTDFTGQRANEKLVGCEARGQKLRRSSSDQPPAFTPSVFHPSRALTNAHFGRSPDKYAHPFHDPRKNKFPIRSQYFCQFRYFHPNINVLNNKAVYLLFKFFQFLISQHFFFFFWFLLERHDRVYHIYNGVKTRCFWVTIEKRVDEFRRSNDEISVPPQRGSEEGGGERERVDDRANILVKLVEWTEAPLRENSLNSLPTRRRRRRIPCS